MSLDPRCAWLIAKNAKYHALSVKLAEKQLVHVCMKFQLAASLCVGDYDFLAAVADAADGDVSMAQIARKLEINPSSATRRARHLLCSGLVSKTADAKDDRRYLIALTPLGRAFWAEMDRRLLRAAEIMYSTVTQEEMGAVFSFTDKCIENLQHILDAGYDNLLEDGRRIDM